MWLWRHNANPSCGKDTTLTEGHPWPILYQGEAIGETMEAKVSQDIDLATDPMPENPPKVTQNLDKIHTKIRQKTDQEALEKYKKAERERQKQIRDAAFERLRIGREKRLKKCIS